MEKLIETIPKNRREEIRVSLTAYHDRDLVDVRVYCEPYAGDVWVATKRGISLSVTKLPALIKALQAAEREAQETGLLEEPETPATAPIEATEAAPDSADEAGLAIIAAG